MNDEIINRIKEIDRENFIYIIFFIILILSYIANEIEKDYFIKRNDIDKNNYYYLQIFIFGIIVLVNIYYVIISYREIRLLQIQENFNKRKYAYLDFIASLAALVAGLILLYIAITDREIDAEISL